MRVRILAVNDVYELTNLPKLLALKRSLRPAPNAFVLAGDFLSPSVLTSVDQGRGMVDMLNRIGITHVCLGNHEADLPLATLSKRIAQSNFTWINTNMPAFPDHPHPELPPKRSGGANMPSGVGGADPRQSEKNKEKKLLPMESACLVSSECGKASVALLGLLSDEANMFRDGTFKGVAIESVQDHVLRAQRHFQSEFDVRTVVPLTHQSLEADLELARRCDLEGVSLPVVIGGHEHVLLVETHRRRHAPIAPALAGALGGAAAHGAAGVHKESCEAGSALGASFEDLVSFHSSDASRETTVVKSGQDAVYAAVIDLWFEPLVAAPASGEAPGASGGASDTAPSGAVSSGAVSSGAVSSPRIECVRVEVSVVSVAASAALAPDEDCARAAAKHMSVVDSLEDAAIVDLSKGGLGRGFFRYQPRPPRASWWKALTSLGSAALEGTWPLSSERARFRQTTVGALVALAAKHELGAELGMVNGAPIKGNRAYPTGRITFRELKEELPFPMKMVTVPLPGHVIQAAVTHSRTFGEEGKERRGFLQVDASVVVEGQYDWLLGSAQVARHGMVTQGHGHRILSVSGEPFDPKRVYLTALPRNLLKGFCEIVPLVEWAKEADEAQQHAELRAKEEQNWEKGWMAYKEQTDHTAQTQETQETQAQAADGTKKWTETASTAGAAAAGEGEGAAASEAAWEARWMHFDEEEEEESGKELTGGPCFDELARALPSEDSHIPCILLVTSYFSKRHFIDLAKAFTFEELDEDGSGEIDRHEVAAAYARKYGHGPPPEVLLDAMMAALDRDGTEGIGREEFNSILAK